MICYLIAIAFVFANGYGLTACFFLAYVPRAAHVCDTSPANLKATKGMLAMGPCDEI